MNLAHFHMKLRPFRASPDSQFYYPAAAHEAMLQNLHRALENEEGLILITGAPGTGKTLVAHMLLVRLGAQASSALITNCRFASRRDLLQAILFDLGLPYLDRSEQELRLALTEHVLQNHAVSRRSIFVLDEAQDLVSDVLEELRLLSNLETSRGRAMQIVLVAQPEFLLTLRRPEMAILHQRLTVRLHIDPLEFHEAADYILHQLRQAGANVKELITDDAVATLARHTSGVPRLLNQAGAQALALAESGGATCVDIEVALETLTSLGIKVELEATHDQPAANEPEQVNSIDPESEMVQIEPPGRTEQAMTFPAAATSRSPVDDFSRRKDLAGAYIYEPGRPVRIIASNEG